MKKRLLFVDDEPNILTGLRRMLRANRGEWDMTFCASGKEAIGRLNEGSFDAVVSDMRMPNMDGASLLTWVQGHHPQIVRVVLSGYSEETAVMRTVGVAHRYLAKPCDAKTLIETIDGAFALRRYLDIPNLTRLISRLEDLPSLPHNFRRLLATLDDPRSSNADVTDVIAADLALTAQTLKLTNSAYFSLPQRIDTLSHAVSLLGIELIKSLALCAGFYSAFSGKSVEAKRLERLSERALGISLAAKAIAKAENLSPADIDRAGTSSVLAHVGTLVYQTSLPEKFSEVEKLIEREDLAVIEAERKVFGAAHPEVGAYLLGLWGFPDLIADVVAHHHQPKDGGGDKVTVSVCVHVAQHLMKVAGFGDDRALERGVDYLKTTLPDHGDRLEGWARIVRQLTYKMREGVLT